MHIKRPTVHKNVLFKLRPVLRWLVKLRGSIKAIAGGFALGTFIAFTPTIGFQVILALFFATLFGVNRASAVIPVWITNPVTMAPLFTFNYWVGCLFWNGPPVSVVSQKLLSITKELARLDVFALQEQFETFFHLGKEIIIPLLIGSILVGLLAGMISYSVVYRMLHYLQNHRLRKRKK